MKILTKNRGTAALATATVVLATMLAAGPAVATEQPASGTHGGDPGAEIDAATLRRLELLDTAVDRRTHTFDAGLARDNGSTEQEIDEFAAGYQAGGGDVLGTEVPAAPLASAVRACKGRNAADYTGLQANIYLNSCVSSELAYQLTGSGISLGATVALLVAATGVGAPVAAVIAGGLSVAGFVYSGCTKKGTGTAIHGIPPTAAIWCNAQ